MDLGYAFEWDDAKARSNLAKHGVPVPYAARVFLDSGIVDLDTSRPGDGELRRKAVGNIEGRLFTVVYTLRDGCIRMISARRCNLTEERRYGPLHPRSD